MENEPNSCPPLIYHAGAIGSGTGILLTVTIIYDLYEAFVRENAGDFKNVMALM
jgi:hypothetical protein